MQMPTSSAVSRATDCDTAWKTDAIERLATLVQCKPDDRIHPHAEETRYLLRVVAGAARKCSLTPDGRRQIVDFLLPGDVSGFCLREGNDFSTEAIGTGTLIARYPRVAVDALAEVDPQVSRWIRETAFESISRLQARTLILGQTSSLARVSAFLLEWAERCGRTPAAVISLPMSRYDIADYLAIAVETVSRAFTVLRTRRVIAFCGSRGFTICNRAALTQAVGGDVLSRVCWSPGPVRPESMAIRGVRLRASWPDR